jgi:hypothetical protein
MKGLAWANRQGKSSKVAAIKQCYSEVFWGGYLANIHESRLKKRFLGSRIKLSWEDVWRIPADLRLLLLVQERNCRSAVSPDPLFLKIKLVDVAKVWPMDVR